MKNTTVAVALVLAVSTALATHAADEPPAAAQPAQTGSTYSGHGVVNSVNAAAGRLNITHDPIESLQWPKMKMNFKVQDPALLQGLKAGTEVDFELQKVGDDYVVAKIRPVK